MRFLCLVATLPPRAGLRKLRSLKRILAQASAWITGSGAYKFPAPALMISGINFLVTIIKMRAPGMTLMRMPIFTWAALFSNVLIVTIFPILAITIAMLSAD